MYKWLGVVCFFLLLGCKESGSTNDVPDSKKPVFEGNIFNPYYMEYLLSSPNAFGPVWEPAVLNQMEINEFSVYIKGGNNPDHILEKFVYTLNDKGSVREFNYYLYSNSLDLLSNSNFSYTSDNQLSKIDISKYFGARNLPPSFVKYDTSRVLVVTSKSNGKNDSLIFYPTVEKPAVIVDKIGSFTNMIEIIVPEGSSTRDIKAHISQIDTNLAVFEYAEKVVTFTKDGYPQESYHLGDNWNQLEKCKSWTYNSLDQPVEFRQWLHGTLIKDISITYGEDHLPKQLLFNRKKYFFSYKK
jgi:hypothetical protein